MNCTRNSEEFRIAMITFEGRRPERFLRQHCSVFIFTGVTFSNVHVTFTGQELSMSEEKLECVMVLEFNLNLSQIW